MGKINENICEISKEDEEKRLNDVEKIVQNWEKIPEYARGKFDGIVFYIRFVLPSGRHEKSRLKKGEPLWSRQEHLTQRNFMKSWPGSYHGSTV